MASTSRPRSQRRLVCRKQLALSVLPVQTLFNSFSPARAKLAAQGFRLDQFQYLLSKVDGIVGARIERCVTGRDASLGQIELDDRPPVGHVLEHLGHRAAV